MTALAEAEARWGRTGVWQNLGAGLRLASFCDASRWSALSREPCRPDSLAGRLRHGDRGRARRQLAGYYPHERVFLREVGAVGEILAERFAAEGRIVRLANSEAAPMRYPLANTRNIPAASDAVADAITEEDVALLFLTSHGGEKSTSSGYWPIGTPDLTATDLAAR